MRPRRLPELARVGSRAAVPLALALAVALSLSASAQAATVQQKAFKIFQTQYRAELAYSTAQMQANVTNAQTNLASTAGSIETLSYSNNSAATALVDELEIQYDAAGTIGIFKPARMAFAALSKLPLKRAYHNEAVSAEASVKRALAVNTAADLASWQAVSFAPASEPADTKAFGGFFGLTLPALDIPISASRSQVKAFNKLANSASNKVNAVFNTIGNDWSTWIAGYGVQT